MRDGYYEVRFQIPTGGGNFDTRILSVVRRHGRFQAGPTLAARESCGLLRSFRLTRPVFGGSNGRPLVISYRLGSGGSIDLAVLRGRHVLAHHRAKNRRAGRIYRVSVAPIRGLSPRGQYSVRLRVLSGKHRAGATLTAFRL
jgi:hypothetical protein